LAPLCEDAHLGGCRGQLETDHSILAWAKHERGQSIQLQDVSTVCHFHNVLRGNCRGDNVTRTT